jgi:DNA-binding MarR family transcriptional regulator
MHYMLKRVYLRKKSKKTPTYQFHEKQHNFLKYWRVVKYYIKDKYEISDSVLEMLLFLYDENVFTKATFNEFARTMSWDKNRFSKLVEAGFIKKWRDRKQTQRSSLWELTIKSKRICNHLYKKLTQEEEISENPYRNEIFKGNSHMDRVYKDIIRAMNAKTRSHNET